MDEITNQVEPFYRLFNIVLKWQKAEKKYDPMFYFELNLMSVLNAWNLKSAEF